METKLALKLIKRLVQKGLIYSAELICYDYNIDLDIIKGISNENKK